MLKKLPIIFVIALVTLTGCKKSNSSTTPMQTPVQEELEDANTESSETTPAPQPLNATWRVEADSVKLPEFAIILDNDALLDKASANGDEIAFEAFAEIFPHDTENLPMEEIVDMTGGESGDGTIVIANARATVSKQNKRAVLALQIDRKLYDKFPTTAFAPHKVTVYLRSYSSKDDSFYCIGFPDATAKSIAGAEYRLQCNSTLYESQISDDATTKDNETLLAVDPNSCKITHCKDFKGFEDNGLSCDRANDLRISGYVYGDKVIEAKRFIHGGPNCDIIDTETLCFAGIIDLHQRIGNYGVDYCNPRDCVLHDYSQCIPEHAQVALAVDPRTCTVTHCTDYIGYGPNGLPCNTKEILKAGYKLGDEVLHIYDIKRKLSNPDCNTPKYELSDDCYQFGVECFIDPKKHMNAVKSHGWDYCDDCVLVSQD